MEEGGDAEEVLAVADVPPLPLRIITAATAATMMITTTIPAISRVDEEDEAEVVAVTVGAEELVLTAVVGAADVEVLGGALDEEELFVLKADDEAAVLEVVVGGGALDEVFDDVVAVEPT